MDSPCSILLERHRARRRDIKGMVFEEAIETAATWVLPHDVLVLTGVPMIVLVAALQICEGKFFIKSAIIVDGKDVMLGVNPEGKVMVRSVNRSRDVAKQSHWVPLLQRYMYIDL